MPLGDIAEYLGRERRRYADAAGHYGGQFRDGIWLMYLLVPLGVASSVAPKAFGIACAPSKDWLAALAPAGEIGLLALVVLIFWLLRRNEAKHQWIRQRQIAEEMRYLPLLAPFVREWSSNWYEEIRDRQASGITPDPEISNVCQKLAGRFARPQPALQQAAFFEHFRRHVIRVLEEQIHYHEGLTHSEAALASRISRLGIIFFVTGLLSALTEFLTGIHQILLLSASLPALGGALHGALAQGESERIAMRSRDMVETLKSLRKKLSECIPDGTGTDWSMLERLVWDAVQALIAENRDWVILQRLTPLRFPG